MAKKTVKKKQIRITNRQQKVLGLLKSGATYRKIAKITGTSLGTVHRDVSAVLETFQKRLTLSAQKWIQLELQRLDELHSVLWTQVFEPGTDQEEIIKLVLAIMDRRAKYLGLHSSRKVEIKVDARKELAKLLGVSEEDLPDGQNMS